MKIIMDVLYYKPTHDEVRQMLNDALHKGECIVEFKKVNGELRTMPCTLRGDLMPPAPKVVESTEPKVEKKVNENIMSVWCTDKQAWRSFRIDSVISFDTLTAE